MKLKLFLHIEACGTGNWYCYETFDEFYEAVIYEYYDHAYEEFNTVDKVKKLLEECPYTELLEILPEATLRFTNNEGACSEFPDSLLNMKEDEEITVKNFLKHCNHAGYLGYELFEIM